MYNRFVVLWKRGAVDLVGETISDLTRAYEVADLRRRASRRQAGPTFGKVSIGISTHLKMQIII